MRDFYDDDDAATNLIERRWFAASAKVKTLQDECDVMLEVMEQAAQAYRGARLRLAELESLRDGLAERLTPPEETFLPAAKPAERARELSAA
jgi:hypothetical protein